MKDLKQQSVPVVCPPRQQDVWNMHPRVYLNIGSSGQAVCPYCGKQYSKNS